MRTTVDRRGIVSFLAITFGITYAIELALILSGFRMTELPPMYGQLVIAGAMWAPALATVLTVKCITREGFGLTCIRIGALRPCVTAAPVGVDPWHAWARLVHGRSPGADDPASWVERCLV